MVVDCRSVWGVPDWVTQRLWWIAVVAVAIVGRTVSRPQWGSAHMVW
jgi:hypothetical protein